VKPVAFSGFTLIEMVVTLTILSVMAMAAMPLAEGVMQYTQERELNRALTEIRSALDRYKEAVDSGRIAPQTRSGYPPNLGVLVTGVPEVRATGFSMYFLRRIPRDPFCPREIADEQCWGVRAYDSPANAPVPGRDVYDIHSLSNEEGSDGRPYRTW
jgi:general secretion pathway protein G